MPWRLFSTRSVRDDRGSDHLLVAWWNDRESPRAALAHRRAQAALADEIERKQGIVTILIIIAPIAVIVLAPALWNTSLPEWTTNIGVASLMFAAVWLVYRNQIKRTHQRMAI